MRKKKLNIEEHDDGSYIVKKSRKSNILAFILCVLIAFVIWAYAVNKEQKIAEETADNVSVIYTDAQTA